MTQQRSSTAVIPAQPNRQAAYDRLKNLLAKAEPKLMERLPELLSPQRMIADVLTSIERTPRLLKCEPFSVVGTVLQAAELGLRLNGFLGEAYMVPFWNKYLNNGEGGLQAQFQAGYRGLITLARRSGEVTKIEPRLVFTFDTKFELRYGTNPHIEHEPAIDHPDYSRVQDGDLVGLRGAYAVCTYKEGNDFEFCNINRLHELRARSQSRDKDGNEVGPWTTDPGEMYRKVPIRQLAKRLPLSTDDGRFNKAALLDEYGDAGVAQNNAALITEEPAFASMLADTVRAQVDDLVSKHLPARPATSKPAATPAQGTRPYHPRARQQAQQAA